MNLNGLRPRLRLFTLQPIKCLIFELNNFILKLFSQRCSPSQWFGPKRYRPCPCKVEDLPKIDAVIISHNHYDHLDVGTVNKLNAK